jgi:hypothetical protein
VKTDSPLDLTTLNSASPLFVKVQVVALPSLNVLDTAAQTAKAPIYQIVKGRKIIVGYRTELANALRDESSGAGAQATIGQRGFVSTLSLKKAGDMSFLVDHDSKLLALPPGSIGPAVRMIRLAMTGTDYNIERCCPLAPNMAQANPSTTSTDPCSTEYVFNLFDPGSNTVKTTFKFNPKTCMDQLSSLLPVPDSQFAQMSMLALSLSATKNFEAINTLGLVKIPVSSSGQGPFGSQDYDPETAGSNLFMNPTSLCSFSGFLQDHQSNCKTPGCQVQFGDAYSPKRWDEHTGHETASRGGGPNGTCIDVHPMRHSNGNGPVEVGDRNLDSIKTLQMIAEVYAHHGSVLWGPLIKPINREMRFLKFEHRNHIHICFDPRDEAVQKDCSDLVNASKGKDGILGSLGGLLGNK